MCDLRSRRLKWGIIIQRRHPVRSWARLKLTSHQEDEAIQPRGESVQPIARGSNLGRRDFTPASLKTRPYRPRYDARRRQENGTAGQVWQARARRPLPKPNASRLLWPPGLLDVEATRVAN